MHVGRYRRNRAKPERSFECKTERHETATRTAGRERATRVDSNLSGKLVDYTGQEPHIVDAWPVRAVSSHSAARVPVTAVRVRIGIDDCKVMLVGEAIEPIPSLDSDSRGVFTRAVQYHDEGRAFRKPPRHIRREGPSKAAGVDAAV